MVPQLHLHVLASGSKGNAAIVEGADASILIDCGISRRELHRRADELGLDLGQVRGIIITHEHTDHVRGLPVVLKHFDGPVYATAPTIAARSTLVGQGIECVGHSDEFDIGGVHISTFPTSHDVADPIGMRFSSAGDAIGYCTDTGRLSEEAIGELEGVRILALEANHDERMLAAGPYPGFLKERVASEVGHLSNRQAAEALRELVSEKTEVVVAMHLSAENNRPSVCIRTLAEALGAEQANTTFTEASTPDGRLFVCAAAQDRPMSIY